MPDAPDLRTAAQALDRLWAAMPRDVRNLNEADYYTVATALAAEATEPPPLGEGACAWGQDGIRGLLPEDAYARCLRPAEIPMAWRAGNGYDVERSFCIIHANEVARFGWERPAGPAPGPQGADEPSTIDHSLVADVQQGILADALQRIAKAAGVSIEGGYGDHKPFGVLIDDIVRKLGAPDEPGDDDRCRVSENGSVFHRWACDFGPDCPAPGGVMRNPQGADEPGEQALAYIRRHYGVPAEAGRYVTVNGDHGAIVGGQDARLLVDFGDGPLPCHPTWRVDYGGAPDEPDDDDPVTVLRGLLDHAVQSWSPRGTGPAPLLAEWDDTDWADSGWTDAERVELRAAIDRVRPDEEATDA